MTFAIYSYLMPSYKSPTTMTFVDGLMTTNFATKARLSKTEQPTEQCPRVYIPLSSLIHCRKSYKHSEHKQMQASW